MASALVAAALPALGGTASAAAAPPQIQYEALLEGDFTIAGNTLNVFGVTDADSNPAANPPPSDSFSDGSTRASVIVPAGATITKALLYVFYYGTSPAPTQMLFAAPGQDYVTQSMDFVGDHEGEMLRADVTAPMAAAGPGQVWVGVPAAVPTSAKEHLQAWGLFVAYSKPGLPWRQVAIVDQARKINTTSSSSEMSATIEGLATPPATNAGARVAEFSLLATAGQLDSLRVCPGMAPCPDDPGSYGDPAIYAQNGPNPPDDIANTTFTVNGGAIAGAEPAAQFSFADLDLFDMADAVPAGETSLTLTHRSLGDSVFKGVLALSAPVYSPHAELTATATALTPVNGVVDFTLSYDLDNSGDDAINVVVTDTLPAGATIVTDSARVLSGANAGPKSGAGGDDQVDVVGSTLTWRVGAGATAASGGAVATTDGPQTLTFKAQVTSGIPGDVLGDDAEATFNGARAPTLPYIAVAEAFTTLVAVPVLPALVSTGVATALQSVTMNLSVGASPMLLDAGDNPTTTLTIVDQGTYTLVPAAGAITFSPVLGFTGEATPARYRATSAGGSAVGTYTPTVTLPPPPEAPDLSSSGVATAVQTVSLSLPAGGTVVLVASTTSTLEVPAQGTYALDRATGRLTFTPLRGFDGVGIPVGYRVTDAYSQGATGVYTATVLGLPVIPVSNLPVIPVGNLPVTGGHTDIALRLAAVLLATGIVLIARERFTAQYQRRK